jgi:hypothetical protein
MEKGIYGGYVVERDTLAAPRSVHWAATMIDAPNRESYSFQCSRDLRHWVVSTTVGTQEMLVASVRGIFASGQVSKNRIEMAKTSGHRLKFASR